MATVFKDAEANTKESLAWQGRRTLRHRRGNSETGLSRNLNQGRGEILEGLPGS